MRSFLSVQDLLLYNHIYCIAKVCIIHILNTFFCVASGLVNVYFASLGFAGGRVVIPSSGGFSRRFTIFVRGRTATDTCSAVAICSSSFARAGPFRGIGSGSGPVRSGPFREIGTSKQSVYHLQNCIMKLYILKLT